MIFNRKFKSGKLNLFMKKKKFLWKKMAIIILIKMKV